MGETRSLKKRGSNLANSREQIKLLSSSAQSLGSFADKLNELKKSPLRPKELEILQINLGYMCNQVCEHCHVDAGPDRKEIMTKEVMNYCLKAIENSTAHTVDLTGGAPEMNPHFQWFVEELAKRQVKVIVRSNLTILESNKKFKEFPHFFKKHNVTVIASLPCYSKENVDKQRGEGVFADSIRALIKLNELGYGKLDSGLELHLVFNPGGASLPPDQKVLELDYKAKLKDDFGIEFNNLYTITNLPISRFLDYLWISGQYEQYMVKLVNAFNPKSVDELMCRNTISVGWNGLLHDCDFNQMLNLGLEKNAPQTIQEFDSELLTNRPIITNQHCFGCTAGAGSGCQGALI